MASVLVDYVAMAVADLIAVKFRMRMFDGMFSASRNGPVVAMLHIVVSVYVTGEVFRAVKPRAGSDEDAIDKPIRAVVAVRGAVIGGIVVVAVWTYWRGSDGYGHLGMGA